MVGLSIPVVVEERLLELEGRFVELMLPGEQRTEVIVGFGKIGT